jgi:hypothetical protein
VFVGVVASCSWKCSFRIIPRSSTILEPKSKKEKGRRSRRNRNSEANGQTKKNCTRKEEILKEKEEEEGRRKRKQKRGRSTMFRGRKEPKNKKEKGQTC